MFQLVKLEDEFTSLLQGASADTQTAFSAEMDQVKRQHLDESASAQDDDSSLVPDDYQSDEERTGDEKEDDDEQDTCHVTKVCLRDSRWVALNDRALLVYPPAIL